MKRNKRRRKRHIDNSGNLSLLPQCGLLGIHRSALYYRPTSGYTMNLELMRLVDVKHLIHPWLGVCRITNWLNRDRGYRVNHKRIERLYGFMHIAGIRPKPNTSKKAHHASHAEQRL